MGAKTTIKLYNKNNYNTSEITISGTHTRLKDLSNSQLSNIINILDNAKEHVIKEQNCRIKDE